VPHRIFKQDGAKAHQNNRVRACFSTKGVEYIEDWPPYPTDLNMSELLWPLLNQLVANRHPSTKQQLRAAIVASWNSILQAQIDAICGGFKKKVLEVRGKGGALLNLTVLVDL